MTESGGITRRDLLRATSMAFALPKLFAQNMHADAGAADDEEFWARVRDLFPIDPNVIQLNNAAIGSTPIHVLDAVKRYSDMLVSQPSHFYYDEQEDYIERVRSQLAAFFGCDAEELAVTRNASEGLHNVIFGLDLKPGDEVLTTTQDYPSMRDSLQQRAAREGIIFKTFSFPLPPQSEDDLYDRFEKEVTERTRVLLISHMTWTTGQIFPVRQLCEMAAARNIQTIIDGAQSFGHIPVRRDDLKCDYFATSLHKFFSAPLGTGFLYIRRDHVERLWALMGSSPQLKNNIRKFDNLGPGTMPIHLRNAIPEAISFNESLTVTRKAERLRYLRRRWMTRLNKVPGVKLLNSDDPSQSCGTAAFIPGTWDVQHFVQVLQRQHQIQVRARGVAGEFTAVRVSPNVFTTAAEIDRFSDVAQQLIPRGEKS
ncbi:MAG: aminotransferase class V-fold PLP-dependent enzyme [Terriglobales bacterium]